MVISTNIYSQYNNIHEKEERIIIDKKHSCIIIEYPLKLNNSEQEKTKNYQCYIVMPLNGLIRCFILKNGEPIVFTSETDFSHYWCASYPETGAEEKYSFNITSDGKMVVFEEESSKNLATLILFWANTKQGDLDIKLKNDSFSINLYRSEKYPENALHQLVDTL